MGALQHNFTVTVKMKQLLTLQAHSFCFDKAHFKWDVIWIANKMLCVCLKRSDPLNIGLFYFHISAQGSIFLLCLPASFTLSKLAMYPSLPDRNLIPRNTNFSKSLVLYPWKVHILSPHILQLACKLKVWKYFKRWQTNSIKTDVSDIMIC